MKTRDENMRQAMKEALEMIQQGRHADAAETLSAALEAPAYDVSARDAALEEAANEMTRINEARAAIRIRALQFAPAQMVSTTKVRDVLTGLRHGTGNEGAAEYDKACRDFADEAARRLGMDLNATA